MAAPVSDPALALECSLFLHVADAALAVVLDVFGEVDEVLDVVLCSNHNVSKPQHQRLARLGPDLHIASTS